VNRIYLVLTLLILAGCGDTTNNTTSSTPPATSSSVTIAQVVGLADIIPSNTQCTTEMNKIFTAKGEPDQTWLQYIGSSIQRGIVWEYSGATAVSVYFDWYTDSAICSVHEVIHTVPAAPPTVAGNATFIPSNTYCTTKMNEQFALYGKSQDMYSTNDYTYDYFSHTWNYPALGIDLYFNWGNGYNFPYSIVTGTTSTVASGTYGIGGYGDGLCHFSSRTYTPIPSMATPPPPETLAGAAPFIPSDTYCTSQINAIYLANGEPPYYSTSNSFSYNSLSMHYYSIGKTYYFNWGIGFNGCSTSVDTYTPM
jgi:hypothetical protein